MLTPFLSPSLPFLPFPSLFPSFITIFPLLLLLFLLSLLNIHHLCTIFLPIFPSPQFCHFYPYLHFSSFLSFPILALTCPQPFAPFRPLRRPLLHTLTRPPPPASSLAQVLSRSLPRQVDVGTRNQCRDVYSKIRTSKIDEDLYASQALQITEKDGKFQVKRQTV